MTPFFSTSPRLEALAAEAARWPGTPFANFGAVAGPDGGASCHCLAGAVLSGSGFAVEQLPRVRVTWGQQNNGGLMLPWLRARGSLFFEITPCEISALAPGDLLVANLGELCEHHIGLCVPGGSVLHTLRKGGARLTGIADPFLKSVLVAIFRPIEQ